MFEIYVLKNEISGKIYIGYSQNKEERLKRHNGEKWSKTRSYTRINKGKWAIIYSEKYQTREEAIKREKYLKSHIGRDWLREKILGP